MFIKETCRIFSQPHIMAHQNGNNCGNAKNQYFVPCSTNNINWVSLTYVPGLEFVRPTNQLYFRSGICSHQQNLLCVSQTTGVRVDVAAPTLHPQLSLFPNQFNKIHFFIIFIFQSKGVDCMGLWCLWLMPYMLESLSTSVISHGYWNTKWQLIIYEMSRKYPRLKSI